MARAWGRKKDKKEKNKKGSQPAAVQPPDARLSRRDNGVGIGSSATVSTPPRGPRDGQYIPLPAYLLSSFCVQCTAVHAVVGGVGGGCNRPGGLGSVAAMLNPRAKN